jgi:hypothetical protein
MSRTATENIRMGRLYYSFADRSSLSRDKLAPAPAAFSLKKCPQQVRRPIGEQSALPGHPVIVGVDVRQAVSAAQGAGFRIRGPEDQAIQPGMDGCADAHGARFQSYVQDAAG